MPKKILIIDDSALMRRVLSDIIGTDKRFMLSDAAGNGLEAYDLITTNPGKYDLLILDINMPKMSGIQLLEKLNDKKIHIPTIMVSSIAKEGAAETIRCLELGASDFITKPDNFLETKSDKFRDKVVRFMCGALGLPLEASEAPAETKPSAGFPSRPAPALRDDKPVTAAAGSHTADGGPMSYVRVTFTRKPHAIVSPKAEKLVAIACSTGGPKALHQLIPMLPANINAPIVLVQHMPEGFTGTLAARLNETSNVKVEEAVEGTILKKGTVYIARGGKHLRIIRKGKDLAVSIGDDAPRNTLKPCADIMYESLINLSLEEVVCVVLTGMGSDGTRGIGQLSQKTNCYVIAQDEASSTVYGMPRMVKEAGLTDEVVPLGSIAGAIANIVGTC
ncbi:MAG: chemotaxis-specific protein-glutamate methyltransferase CheB [Lachnospiraceae bacterium]|nr:chemotaxis-specific protein-glutamate methyltransferase CheB [Lachnospiraceae bacterium]